MEINNPISNREANQYSPLALAFLGDGVYDLLVREYILKKANMPVSKLHSHKVKLVCAEFQARVYENILEKLTENEISVLKRGRNATGNTAPKHSKIVDYRKATAVECLFGYLHLIGDYKRIYELFNDIIMLNQIENQE